MTDFLKAPFPYFGGKSRAAPMVWERFGDVKSYIEPFAGSAAMLLAAPEGRRVETLNDMDGFIVNFWRAVAHDPDAVAHWADWPVTEADLVARHAWLVNRRARLTWQLEDPDFFDPKIAGWWVWGACAWIGSGWCSGRGPHVGDGAHVVDTRQLPHLGCAGRGINRKLPHLSTGQGINRKLPHLGNAGQGINRQLPHLGNAGQGAYTRRDFITDWFTALHERLRDVRITQGDWRRVLGRTLTEKFGVTAVFLDPPYTEGDMDYGAGGMGLGVADDVCAWCAENGDRPNLRIALCGHGGEHADLEALGWVPVTWKAFGGYARTEAADARRKSETIWFSPACVSRDEQMTMVDAT